LCLPTTNPYHISSYVVVAPGDIVVVDPGDLSRVIVKVEGAGVAEVNGDYIFIEMLNGAGWFEKQTSYGGKPVAFSIYRCRMENGSINWFISICSDQKHPGNSTDHDFYSCPSLYELHAMSPLNDRAPPCDGWLLCSTEYGHSPTIRYDPESFIQDTDSTRDDCSLNVGDDDNFDDSFPSAPESPNEFGNNSALYE
jgi:hypothetical protein